jgi:alpha-aminoadipate carrier protein LysW
MAEIEALQRPEERVKELGTRFEIEVKRKLRARDGKEINKSIKEHRGRFTDLRALNHARHTRNCIVHGDGVTDQQIAEAERGYKKAIDDLCAVQSKPRASAKNVGSRPRVLCPECDAPIQIDESALEEWDTFICDECSSELTVCGKNPLQLDASITDEADFESDEDEAEGTDSVKCPECGAALEVDESALEEGDSVVCDGCGSDLSVRETNPLQLEVWVALEVDDDWDGGITT